jgi:DNA-binding NarL/FixJ family response regulator
MDRFEKPSEGRLMRVVVADPRRELRSAIRILLEQERGIRVVGEVDRLPELPLLLESEAPDALLIDWGIRKHDMDVYVTEIKRAYPKVKVIVMSVRSTDRQSALEAGADAFVCKCDPPEALVAELLGSHGSA